MSENRKTVETYMDAYGRGDRAAVLSCLTDDVVWLMPGVFHLTGKAAFDREIDNPAFKGIPAIEVTRIVEEKDIVVAEGTVRAIRSDGGILNAVFCDVFLMQAGRIRQLTSYVMAVPESTTP